MSGFKPALALIAVASLAINLDAQDRSYGRSVVATQFGIVATSQVSASQAGARVLEQGGSAIDAAIAANAVLNVTEPTSNGMGGDLFAIYWEAKTGKLYGLNASGWAPKVLSIEHLKSKGIAEKMPEEGIDSVTVPGVVDGWTKLHKRFGRLPWRDLFQPAIYYAEHGFPVSEIIHAWWTGDSEGLRTNPESTRVFLPGGKAPETGQVFRNPDIARAFRLIADQGESAFYNGDIAKAILKTSSDLGGTMTADDLASYSANGSSRSRPLIAAGRVYELPPNGAGHRRTRDAQHHGALPAVRPVRTAPQELHKRIEAMKLAYADVNATTPIRASARFPVAGLLSKEYAGKRAAPHRSRARQLHRRSGIPAASDTTYLTRRRSRRKHRLLHSEQLQQLRIARDGGGHGLRPAESRRRYSRSIRNHRTCSRAASGRSTRLFRPSWRRAISTSASASWADRISRWRMRSSSRILSITG